MRQNQRHRHIVKMKTVQDMALSDHNLKVITIKMETVRSWRQGKPPHYTMGEASGRGNKRDAGRPRLLTCTEKGRRWRKTVTTGN